MNCRTFSTLSLLADTIHYIGWICHAELDKITMNVNKRTLREKRVVALRTITRYWQTREKFNLNFTSIT